MRRVGGDTGSGVQEKGDGVEARGAGTLEEGPQPLFSAQVSSRPPAAMPSRDKVGALGWDSGGTRGGRESAPKAWVAERPEAAR